MRPSSSVITTPNSSGLSTDFSASVASAPRSRWKASDLRQVEVAERVARDHDERLVEQLLGVLDRAGGAERRTPRPRTRCGRRATSRRRGSRGSPAAGRRASRRRRRSRCVRSSSTMCSMHGLPQIGTIGLGWFEVSGRRRVPSPPAITTALIRLPRRLDAQARAHGVEVDHAGREQRETEPDVDDVDGPAGGRVGHHDQAEADHQHRGRGLPQVDHGQLVAASRSHAQADQQHDVAPQDEDGRDHRADGRATTAGGRPSRSAGGRRAGRPGARSASSS